MRRVLVVVALLAATGCVQKIAESRVRSALLDAGLSERNASCMAGRMVDRLSLLQLRRIGRLSQLRGSDPRSTSVESFLHRTRALQDPEILAVVMTSAGVCAFQ